jgi:hypothetical protein
MSSVQNRSKLKCCFKSNPEETKSLILTARSNSNNTKDVFYDTKVTANEYFLKIVESNENDMKQDNILESLSDWTYLDNLDLILSVTGGAVDFSFPSSIKTSFKEGIAKIAMSTNALIITGGTSVGVMKLVGEAIALKTDPPKESTIKLLGIASYERVNYKNVFESKNKEGNLDVKYDFNCKFDGQFCDFGCEHKKPCKLEKINIFFK